ncbi:winged helix-turn-helix domain-containing protein [Algicola sagamiensis]|uniref:winged helix-turn-helix domain-containing protein n=1 Tax=Algicola sagamiensis TaxID=163869 RepID=UPI0003667BA2|nr:winged helix-turn-helix domain-containing protein [Algicola sagamiensis]
MTHRQAIRYLIGEWRFSPDENKLIKENESGEPTVSELDNLCQKVLKYLVEHAGQLVSKDELLEKVWGVSSVSDGRVTRVIRALRMALGDDAKNPSYIETLPKRGYRFIALTQLEEFEIQTPQIVRLEEPMPAGDRELLPIESPSQQPQSENNYQRLLLLSSFTVFALISAIALLFLIPQYNQPADVPFVRVEPLLSLEGHEIDPRISPDGKKVIFRYGGASGDDTPSLVVIDIKTRDWMKIQAKERHIFYSAAWSPDSQHIIIRELGMDNTCRLKLLNGISFDFRSYQLTDIIECDPLTKGATISWDRGGDTIYITEQSKEDNTHKIYSMSLKTGKRTLMTAPPGSGVGDYVVKASPNGKYLAFLRNHAQRKTQLWIMDLNTREQRLITELDFSLIHITWSHDNQKIYFGNHNAQVESVNIKDKSRQVIAKLGDKLRALDSSDDGLIIGLSGSFMKYHFNVSANPLTHPELNTSENIIAPLQSNRSEYYADMGASGQQMVIVSSRTGLQQIWLLRHGKTIQLTQFESYRQITDVELTASGRLVAAIIDGKLCIIDVDSKKLQTLGIDGMEITNPAWFYHENKLLFSMRTKKGVSLWSYNLNDKKVVQEIANATSGQPSDKADDIYYRLENDHRVYKRNRETGTTEVILQNIAGEFGQELQVVNQHLYVGTVAENDRLKIRFYDLNTKAISSDVFTADTSLLQYSVSLDEKWIMYSMSFLTDLDTVMLKDQIQKM